MESKSDFGIELSAQMGITKNLGNYQSLKLDAGKKVVIPGDADASVEKKAWAALWVDVEGQLEDQLKEKGLE